MPLVKEVVMVDNGLVKNINSRYYLKKKNYYFFLIYFAILIIIILFLYIKIFIIYNIDN